MFFVFSFIDLVVLCVAVSSCTIKMYNKNVISGCKIKKEKKRNGYESIFEHCKRIQTIGLFGSTVFYSRSPPRRQKKYLTSDVATIDAKKALCNIYN